MRICFVGLGSIGSRHLRNLWDLLTERGEPFTVDALRIGTNPLPDALAQLLNRQYRRYEDLPDNYDIAFICNPTHLHYNTIARMSKHAKHLFIEKPVFDRVDYPINALPLLSDRVYYVACPLRYSGVIQYVAQNIDLERVRAVRAICSTYLPNWRPTVDYRTTYSAHRAQGGGVGIDLIHELDYLFYLFGKPQQVEHLSGHYSGLEVDSDDLALYLLRYPEKLVSLHLDYFGCVERREMELYTDEEVVVADLRAQNVRFLKTGMVVSLSEPRDAFQMRELSHFLDIIAGDCANDNSMTHAMDVLCTALGKEPIQ